MASGKILQASNWQFFWIEDKNLVVKKFKIIEIVLSKLEKEIIRVSIQIRIRNKRKGK